LTIARQIEGNAALTVSVMGGGGQSCFGSHNCDSAKAALRPRPGWRVREVRHCAVRGEAPLHLRAARPVVGQDYLGREATVDSSRTSVELDVVEVLAGCGVVAQQAASG
jgi:hypothetical protein